MSEETPPIKRAYEYANDCYKKSAGVVRYLNEAQKSLPEDDTPFREEMKKVIEKAEELMGMYEKLLPTIYDLHVKKTQKGY